MNRLPPLAAPIAVAALALACAGASATSAPAMVGVAEPAMARQHWILQCQGCHGPDAGGAARTTPPMAGTVARFLSSTQGREYLVRVPGVATAALDDRALAQLLNWTVQRFDSAHVPKDFTPYTTEEVRRLRRQPLRTEAPAARAALVADWPSDEPATTHDSKGDRS